MATTHLELVSEEKLTLKSENMKQKDLLILLISAFLLVIAWIIFSVYHNSITSTIPQNLNIQIVPINPDFDSKTIEKLKERKNIMPVYTAENQTQPEVSVTPIISSESANLQNQATPGGILNP